jgi:hypothetical protein
MRFGRLADRFVLQPSRDALPAEGKARRLVSGPAGDIEVWTRRTDGAERDEARLFILKFSGAAGRAERASEHPAELWTDLASEIWAVNPPGFGGSPGRPSLRNHLAAAQRVFAELAGRAAGRPILVVGNSLGAAVALHLAATRPIAGLLIRNPPPLRRLIGRRHGWWNLYLPAMAVALGVPREFDCIAAAAAAQAPAVLVTCGRDRVAPPRFQRPILDEYAGRKRIFTIAEGSHTALVPDEQREEYAAQLNWLRQQMLGER